MTYSYTQISSFLSCPRRYRYQYLEDWQEKETRAAMLFGRAFEQALAAYFLGMDERATWCREWSAVQLMEISYSNGESWQQMLRQGEELLELFAEQTRVRIARPLEQLQIKYLKRIDARDDFVGYVDAFGSVDGIDCLIDWKTSSSCYPAQPQGLIALDPQLICYSWLTGISHVAFVVFVRKRLPDIQYLHATISQAQRDDFDRLVRSTIAQIEQAEFYQHSGIRFPMNQCVSCAYAGLCLQRQQLVEIKLMRRTGADLGWLDELNY